MPRPATSSASASAPPTYLRLGGYAAVGGTREVAAAYDPNRQHWVIVDALERAQAGELDARIVAVRRTISSGKIVELAKTSASRRQVPLSPRALAALDALPPRLVTPLMFPAPAGGLLNLDNFRQREWAPAIEAGGIAKPARIYDLRSTFASNSLAAGIDVFELGRVMGTSIEMIERHYGTLLTGAAAGIAGRLATFEAEQDRATDRATKSV